MQNLGLQNILQPNVKGDISANKAVKGSNVGNSQEFDNVLSLISGNSAKTSKTNPNAVLQNLLKALQQDPNLGKVLAGQPDKALMSNIENGQVKNSLENILNSNKDFKQLLTAKPELFNAINLNIEGQTVKPVNGLQTKVQESVIKVDDSLNLSNLNKLVTDIESTVEVNKVSPKGTQIAALASLKNQNIHKELTADNVIELNNKFAKNNRPVDSTSKLINNSVHESVKNAQLGAKANVYESQQISNNLIQMPTRKVDVEALKTSDDFLGLSSGEQLASITGASSQANSVLFPQVTPQTKVMDLSSISAKDPAELISKISDYINQNAIKNVDKLDIMVKHDGLGKFHVNVERMANDQISLKIITMNSDGADFFKANDVALSKALSHAGIALGDLSIKSHNGQKQSSDMNFMNQNGQSNQASDFKQDDSSQRDSRRRNEMWEEYRERFSA